MSRADLATLRRFYELWNSGDVAALTELFDVDAQVRPALSVFLATTIYRGRKEARLGMRRQMSRGRI